MLGVTRYLCLLDSIPSRKKERRQTDLKWKNAWQKGDDE
jgi:hypothetical protein